VIADINVGILFVFAISSLGRLRRHHGRLGVELEISVPGRAALGRADGVLRGLHRLRDRHGAVVRRFAQPVRHRAMRSPPASAPGWPAELVLDWHWLPLFPMFVIFFISALAETNRRPSTCPKRNPSWWPGSWWSTAHALHDVHARRVCRHRADVRADHHPVPGRLAAAGRCPPFTWVPGHRLVRLKVCLVFFMFSMVKAFVPRYRYDQLMRLGWKVFLPISLAWW
jgi:NADH-quinone oxidoreductase subunit H